MIALLRQFLAAILTITLAIPLSAIASDTTGMNGSVSYTYDPVGNRTQKVSTLPGYPGGLSNYNANDELSTDTYDANGNTTVSNGLGYVYDFENHLVQAGAGISYVYDGDGNRVSKTVAGVTTNYGVDTFNPTGYAQVVTETVSGTSPQSYVYGLERIARFRQFYDYTANHWVYENVYYAYDGHGSVRALTDATGTVTDTYDYDAFGVLIHSTGTTPNSYLYSGEQFDADLGLYYNRARYLNTGTGRFWSMDDDEADGYEPASLHKYLYSQANPVGNIDPSGHVSSGEAVFVAGEGATIGEEEDAAALSIYQTAFRTTLYAGRGVFYETPTILLRAAAALTALVVAAASVISAVLQKPGELPDVAASQTDDKIPNLKLFRDTSGTSPSDFRWRGPDEEPDGLSFFEQPFKNPKQKPFSVGFKASYAGAHQQGALGSFTEPELYGIAVVYTSQLAGGQDHWSCLVTELTAQSYADRFAEAAKRIKREKLSFLPNPNP
jgi:RHS repeat-associated protein